MVKSEVSKNCLTPVQTSMIGDFRIDAQVSQEDEPLEVLIRGYFD